MWYPMGRSLPARPVCFVLLFGLLIGLLVWYGSLPPDPALGALPDETDLATDPAAYLGTKVTFGGTVIQTNPVVVEPRVGIESLRFRLVNLEKRVAVGEEVRVNGVLLQTDQPTIRVHRALVIPRWGYWYAYGISFLAGLWVLARVIRGWHWDSGENGLVPRGRHQAREAVEVQRSGYHTEDSDA